MLRCSTSLLALCGLAACGRAGFGVLGDDASSDALPGDDSSSPVVVPIESAGVWSAGGRLQRVIPTAVGDLHKFTFSSWYRSSDLSTMIFNAGVNALDQGFIWAATTDGRPLYEQSTGGVDWSAAPPQPWLYANTWVHVVIAIDTTQADVAQRARIWLDSVEQTVSTLTTEIPQNLELYFGSAIEHSLGAKFTNDFRWSGYLAETYLIFGEALDASYFVTEIAPGQLRSIEYTGPIPPEAAYFDYEAPTGFAGVNAFPGMPDWVTLGAGTVQMASEFPY